MVKKLQLVLLALLLAACATPVSPQPTVTTRPTLTAETTSLPVFTFDTPTVEIPIHTGSQSVELLNKLTETFGSDWVSKIPKTLDLRDNQGYQKKDGKRVLGLVTYKAQDFLAIDQEYAASVVATQKDCFYAKYKNPDKSIALLKKNGTYLEQDRGWFEYIHSIASASLIHFDVPIRSLKNSDLQPLRIGKANQQGECWGVILPLEGLKILAYQKQTGLVFEIFILE